MKKHTNILVILMAVIGLICTAICVCFLFRDRIKETALFRKFFGEEDDLDMDFFDDDFLDDEEDITPEKAVEEAPVEETEEEAEEVQVPKARRGYIPLRFPSNQSA